MNGRYNTNRASDEHETNQTGGKHGTNRADSEHESNQPNTGHREHTQPPADGEITDNRGTADKTPVVSEDHRREWRRWVIEHLTTATAGVVPVGQLVEQINEQEPEDLSRSRIQTVLKTELLATVEHEPGLEYDADRQVVINYGY